MARINFRQGIVRHQEDGSGNQQFLDVTAGNVSLVVSPDPTIVTFAHGTANYLFTESVSVSNAWGTFTPGINRWLYWDLNLVTGVRTFGFTTFEPVEQSTAPSSPAIGQMWFNTTTNRWAEWNGATWVEVVRAFACRLDVGLVPRSMSINAPDFKGTQVGLTTPVRAGALVFDVSGAPIRKSQNQFFTTEDVFTTGVPTGASLRVNNILIPGQAQAPIAAFTVVEYYEFNRLIPASPYTQGLKVYGMVEEDANTNEIVNFVTEGIIFNEDWDWVDLGADVNDPVYISGTGQIQLTPAIPNQLPVGVVIGRQKILFSPRLFPQVEVAGGGVGTFIELSDTPLDYVGAGQYFLKVNAGETGISFVADPGYLTGVDWGDITGTLSDQTDLLTALNGKANTSHTHVKADITDFAHNHAIADVVGLQTALDGKLPLAGGTMNSGANITFQDGGEVLGLPTSPSGDTAATSKAYVDALIAGRIWKDPILEPNVVQIDVNNPPVAPVINHEAFILGDSPTGDWITFTPGSVVEWNGVNWIDILGRPIQAGDRFGVELEPETYPSINSTVPATDRGTLITITNQLPGSIAYDTYTPENDDTVFVNNELSQHFGHIYTFLGTYGAGVYGTDYKWVETGAPVEIIAGNFLAFSGNTLNVTENFDRILDNDGDTVISVDQNPTPDTDRIKMQLGLNPTLLQAPASGYVLQFTSSFSTGFVIETPSGAFESDVEAISFTLKTGSGDGGGTGGDIDIIAGAGGADGGGGNITIGAGAGKGAGNSGGDIDITTANADTGSDPGAITISTGAGIADVSAGGDIDVSAGNGDDGGSITLDAGFGSGTLGYGGDVSLSAGNGVARGGSVDLQPGRQTSGSPPADHGSVNIRRAGVGIPSEMRFYDGGGADYVGFVSPVDVSAGSTGAGTALVWTLPEGDGTSGQALVTDGNGVLSWATAGGGLPSSTLECSVLVANAVGGWDERSVPELCRPYDVAAQIFGQAPDGGIIFKFKTPQNFRLLDYGHQMDAESLPTVADKTFDVTLNGVSIGSMKFHTLYGPTFDFGGTTGGTIHSIAVGDILRIISPSGDNSGLEDIALTLRGIIEPAAPCGDLSVTFSQALYDNVDPFSGIDMDGTNVTVSGTVTSFEWAALAVSSDNGATWHSLDDRGGSGFSNPLVVFGGFGGFEADSESKYYEVGDFATNVGTTGGSGLRYRVRLTAFGPAGMASDVADFQFQGF